MMILPFLCSNFGHWMACCGCAVFLKDFLSLEKALGNPKLAWMTLKHCTVQQYYKMEAKKNFQELFMNIASLSPSEFGSQTGLHQIHGPEKVHDVVSS